MKHLVLGSSGQIGAHLVKYLQDKGDDFNEDIESLKDTLKRLNSRYRDIDLESNEISFSLKITVQPSLSLLMTLVERCKRSISF